MRLSSPVTEAIVTIAADCLQEGTLRLFGSRLDDGQRGGDIDLYWETTRPLAEALHDKVRFLAKLHRTIGERKVDLVVQTAEQDPSRSVAQAARGTGVVVWQA